MPSSIGMGTSQLMIVPLACSLDICPIVGASDDKRFTAVYGASPLRDWSNQYPYRSRAPISASKDRRLSVSFCQSFGLQFQPFHHLEELRGLRDWCRRQ